MSETLGFEDPVIGVPIWPIIATMPLTMPQPSPIPMPEPTTPSTIACTITVVNTWAGEAPIDRSTA